MNSNPLPISPPTGSAPFGISGDWSMFVVVLLLIMGIIGLSEFLRIRFHWSPESTRKLVHVSVGIAVSVSPLLFQKSTAPLVLAALFMLLNGAALRKASFSGMHGTDRRSYGTVFFPLSYFILVWGEWSRPVSLMVGLFMLTFADTAGSLVGRSIKHPTRYTLWNDDKSLEGSLAVFVTGFFVTLAIAFWRLPEISVHLPDLLLFALVIALLTTLAESVSSRGSDNLSVPLLAALATNLFIVNHALGRLTPWLIWGLFSALIILVSIRLKALSASGGVTAFIIGMIIFGSGGIPWIAPLILFFMVSSILSRLGNRKDQRTQKNSCRDFVQVLANGGVATLVAGIYFYHPSWHWLYPVFLGSLAAATADTWATEIGFFSRRAPRHVLSGKRVEKGMSGGVTLLGFVGSILGSGMIAAVGLYYHLSWQIYLVIFITGILGSILDSILGGTLQALYRYEDTGEVTEKKPTIGRSAHLIRGWRWMDNDMVNVLNTVCGALITLYIFL